MREIEARLLRIDERALLFDMIAEHFRRAQFMRCVAV